MGVKLIRMKRKARGSPTGRNPAYWYEEGETYGPDSSPRMTPELADVFLRAGYAERVEAKTEAADYERKVVEPRAETADTSGMTVNAVLGAVESGVLSREAALEAERAGKARRTLLEALSE